MWINAEFLNPENYIFLGGAVALNICSAGSALHGTGPSCLWEDKVTIAY